MADNDELAQLEQLLCADFTTEQNIKSTRNELTEIDLFKENEVTEANFQDNLIIKTSAIHNGDTDSSDDEEKRNYTRKYDDFGSQVKKILDNKEQESREKRIEFEIRLRETNVKIKASHNDSINKIPQNPIQQDSKNLFCAPEAKSKCPTDVYTDPVFGIRIVKPLISSSVFLDRMQGREAINMLRIKRHVENEDLTKDWVTAGVIVRKSAVKKSQKGSQFIIWTLSDLKNDMKTVSMFLFRKAYNDLWKTSEGTVVAVLNPNVLDRSQNSNDQACLSIDNTDRVMVLGQSKDFGKCKSKKKNGEPCTAFVNLAQCEHCIYHVKQEYHKFSKRAELQSPTMGKGIVNLQNKVFGKDTVIYGGKAYSALPSANGKKVKEKDQNRLMSLSDYYKSESDKFMTNKAPYGAGTIKNNSNILHSSPTLRKTDSERLSKLTEPTSSQKNINKVPHSPCLAEKVSSSPKLGKGFSLKGSGTVDLNMSYGQQAAERAKANAIRLIQQNGGLKRSDPHNTKGTEVGKKRALDKFNLSATDENDNKKFKCEESNKNPTTIKSERFKKILEATSSHQNLVDVHEENEQEKYFSKLEKKEAMEEKMLNTFKLPCKAVRCIKCKYTAFSAAQKCKEERHPLKVLDAFKRFFKCGQCNNRTESLDIIPTHSCRNCSSSKWEKAPMMREKKVALSDELCIRGEEEKYIGTITSGKSINLLVPE